MKNYLCSVHCNYSTALVVTVLGVYSVCSFHFQSLQLGIGWTTFNITKTLLVKTWLWIASSPLVKQTYKQQKHIMVFNKIQPPFISTTKVYYSQTRKGNSLPNTSLKAEMNFSAEAQHVAPLPTGEWILCKTEVNSKSATAERRCELKAKRGRTESISSLDLFL